MLLGSREAIESWPRLSEQIFCIDESGAQHGVRLPSGGAAGREINTKIMKATLRSGWSSRQPSVAAVAKAVALQTPPTGAESGARWQHWEIFSGVSIAP
jgi:hypothetical protein